VVFINPGESSSAQSSSMSLQQSSLEAAIAAEKSLMALLAWLNTEIAKRRAKESEEESEGEPEATSESAESEAEGWSPDRFMEGIEQQVMAATAVKLAQDYGQNDRYQAEGYSIKAQSVDGKEIYTVRDRDHETVMQFERLNGNFIILEDNSTPVQQADFRRASEHMKVLQEQGEDVNENAKTQLKELGDLAPTGTKATVVASTILAQTGQDTYTGSLSEGQSDRYTLSRDTDGAITIRDNQEGFDILLAHKGKIQEAMSDENLQHFSLLYDRLDVKQSASPRVQTKTVEMSQRSIEDLDRQEAEILSDRPEYAPLMQSIQVAAQESQTLPEFCQQLEQKGIHAEVMLKDGQPEAIAYQHEGKWVSGQALGDRHTLEGIQQHLGVDVQSERDIPVLQQQGHIYRDITQAAPSKQDQVDVPHAHQAVESPSVSSPSASEVASNVAEADNAFHGGKGGNASNSTDLENATSNPFQDESISQPLGEQGHERDGSHTINVEHLGALEQSLQQDSSPSVSELSAWLVAAQTLGKSAEEIDQIKSLAREATAGAPQKPSELHRQQPNWKNPDFAMSASVRQRMQDDLTVFGELKRQVGEAGVVRIHQAQQSASVPVRVDHSQDFTQLREILNENGKSGVTEIHQASGTTARSTHFQSDSKTSLRAKDQER
jgi:hypothetical protein